MLDVKRLKKDPEIIVDNLKRRGFELDLDQWISCLLYTSPSPRDRG